MSNIQLWMTPKRDFTVFFPLLHIIILGSMQLSDLLMTYLMYYYHWHYMHVFIAQMMEISIKQIYGWVLYACILLLLLFLLYDMPVRRQLKQMPSWKNVARDVKNSFWRTWHKPVEKQ